MSRDRVERVALTEAAFRIANERMARWEERRTSDAPESFYCECFDPACREELRLTRAEYEAVRANPLRFLVKGTHVLPDLETEVETHERYSVIEKPNALHALLEQADPRTEGEGPARDEAGALADEIVPDDR
jgi:hypothetical protein